MIRGTRLHSAIVKSRVNGGLHTFRKRQETGREIYRLVDKDGYRLVDKDGNVLYVRK